MRGSIPTRLAKTLSFPFKTAWGPADDSAGMNSVAKPIPPSVSSSPTASRTSAMAPTVLAVLHALLLLATWAFGRHLPVFWQLVNLLYWPWILWLIPILLRAGLASLPGALAVLGGAAWVTAAAPMGFLLLVSTFGMGC
jgi:hypothetical protein